MSRVRNSRWLAVSVGLLIADQASKAWVRTLPYDAPLRVLPILNIVRSANDGISFSLLQSSTEAHRWPLIGLSAAAIVVLLGWVNRVWPPRRLLLAGLALIIGGAAGNMLDRIAHGAVTDFIEFHLGTWSFAIFNFADSGISLGVGLMMLESLIRKPSVAATRQ